MSPRDADGESGVRRGAARPQLDDVFESISDPFSVLDSDLRIVFVNAAAAAAIGVDARDLIGSPSSISPARMSEDRTRVLLVEDNPADARLLRELLSESPGRAFDLTVVGTLGAAVSAVADHEIVLLDLSLPDAHGAATVSRAPQPHAEINP